VLRPFSTLRSARRAILGGGLLLLVLAACDSGAAPATPVAPATATAPAATATPALPTTAPTVTSVPATATSSADAAIYATYTALALNDAATATAAAAPSAPSPTALPPTAAPTVPAAVLGTYRLIITARAENYRVYQQPGTLVISAPRPGSGHSAEVQLWSGVRTGKEYADLSPGKTVGGLYVTTSAALLPAGFPQDPSFADSVVYNPATKFLAVNADHPRPLPGGWSTGPNNKAKAPRPITAGTMLLDVGTPGQVSGQIDLHSQPASGGDLLYSGGIQGKK
jgi:hypothetical protein